MQEVSAMTGLPLASVCSLKASMAEELEIVGYDFIRWGKGRKDTKRAQWRLKR